MHDLSNFYRGTRERIFIWPVCQKVCTDVMPFDMECSSLEASLGSTLNVEPQRKDVDIRIPQIWWRAKWDNNRNIVDSQTQHLAVFSRIPTLLSLQGHSL